MPIISRNPAVTLELCFAWQKLQHRDNDPSKVSEYVKTAGTRHRLTRDKEGNIITIPVPRHDVIETKRGRTSTTNRVVTGSMVGWVLGAALNQKPALSNFLQFVYDPDCTLDAVRHVQAFGIMKMRMLLPPKVQQAKRDRCEGLVPLLLENYSQLVRNGDEKHAPVRLCKAMGFNDTRDANYARDYRRLVSDFMLQLQDTESMALAPVCDLIDKIFRDPHASRPVLPDAPVPAQPKPERRIVVKHGTTLSLRRQQSS